jgi:hypothetical protein
MIVDFGYSYLLEAVEALLYGLRLLRDEHDKPVVIATQPYLLPMPTAFPAVCAYPGGGPLARAANAGYPNDALTFTVNLRYVTGKLTDGFTGEGQTKLWLYQPLIINYINQHPHLLFDGTQTFISELHPYGVFCSAIGRFGRFADDTDHLGLEFGVEVPFVVRNRTRFPGV